MTSLSARSSVRPIEAEAPGFRRLLRAEDADAVECLVRAAGVFNDAEIAIARELVEEALAKGEKASGYSFLFADGSDGLDGYTCYGPIPGAVRRMELYWIAAHPRVQHTGLAQRLQRASEAAARAEGAVRMTVETSTRVDYTAARRFYLGQGYTLLAEIPDWHDDGDGMAIYGKLL